MQIFREFSKKIEARLEERLNFIQVVTVILGKPSIHLEKNKNLKNKVGQGACTGLKQNA